MDPKTDYAAWRFYFDLGQYIVAAIIALYIYFSNRNKALTKDLNKVKESTSKDLKSVENRITKLETGAISHKDLGAVYERINSTEQVVSKMNGKMDVVIDGVAMIQKQLLKNGGK